jgi:hypothetical protein
MIIVFPVKSYVRTVSFMAKYVQMIVVNFFKSVICNDI